jgi:hypothetical protein
MHLEVEGLQLLRNSFIGWSCGSDC